MISSLSIMVKTFAKITKTFIGLSMTIVAIKRRPILILQLEVRAKLRYSTLGSLFKILTPV